MVLLIFSASKASMISEVGSSPSNVFVMCSYTSVASARVNGIVDIFRKFLVLELLASLVCVGRVRGQPCGTAGCKGVPVRREHYVLR